MKKMLAILILAISCGGQLNDLGESDSADLEYGTRVSIMHKDAATKSATPHLTYWGGPVIGKAQVIQVLYGAGTYDPNVSGTQMQSFYNTVLNSPYVDFLTEYNTKTQTIQRGSCLNKVAINPAKARNGTKITDASIQAELSAQITSGKLPVPTANTLYMINFPKGKIITQGSSNSCQSGGFCAYHGTLKRNGAMVYYGVLPDMSAGSGCDSGCGSASNLFQNQTSVASHELIEAITDPAVGLATVSGPPLAWYDNSNGEIGDICNAKQGTVGGFTVQLEWSNKQGKCVAK